MIRMLLLFNICFVNNSKCRIGNTKGINKEKNWKLESNQPVFVLRTRVPISVTPMFIFVTSVFVFFSVPIFIPRLMIFIFWRALVLPTFVLWWWWWRFLFITTILVSVLFTSFLIPMFVLITAMFVLLTSIFIFADMLSVVMFFLIAALLVSAGGFVGAAMTFTTWMFVSILIPTIENWKYVTFIKAGMVTQKVLEN